MSHPLASKSRCRRLPLPLGLCAILGNSLKQPSKCRMTTLPLETENDDLDDGRVLALVTDSLPRGLRGAGPASGPLSRVNQRTSPVFVLYAEVGYRLQMEQSSLSFKMFIKS